VEGGRAGDVAVARDELRERAGLGFGEGERTGTGLLALDPPVLREVPVEVETFPGRHVLESEAVVVPDRTLERNTVVGATGLGGVAADHEAGLIRVRLPLAVRVLDAHLEHPPVAVDVFRVQALDRVFFKGPRPGSRAHEARHIRERHLRAVRAHAGADVECARVEQSCEFRIGAVSLYELVDDVEACRRA
jgi:hypothetical protein